MDLACFSIVTVLHYYRLRSKRMDLPLDSQGSTTPSRFSLHNSLGYRNHVATAPVVLTPLAFSWCVRPLCIRLRATKLTRIGCRSGTGPSGLY